VAAITPMAPDEAYYWVWSHALAPGYFDHPPMVALWIRLGTLIAGEGNLGVRLLAPLSAALGSLLLVQAGDDLLGRGRGVMAALLLNATLLFAVGATTMTPDTPLLLFWTAALWALARLVATGDGRWWLVAGAAGGLALDSKYTALLLAPAILAWLLASPSLRPWLRRPQPWAAAALALALFTPVLLWNAGHGWVSFAKQGGREGVFNPGRALQFLAELLAGQLGLLTPLVALLCGAGLVLAVRKARHGDPAWTLLAAVTALPALVFVQHALGDRVQANWPSVLAPGAAIAATGLGPAWRRWMRPAIGLGLGLTALVWTQAAFAPLALPMRLDPTLLRLGGWSDLAAAIAARAEAEHARFVVADNYGQAALLARLLPPGLPVLGTEGRWRYFALPDATTAIAGQTGLLVRSARRDDHPDPGRWSALTPLPPLTRARDGMTAEAFRLYRVIGRAGGQPIVVMPRPD
jgi:4-amino-4-deoxy-L-arabinose transferase-like glycosyltransferase